MFLGPQNSYAEKPNVQGDSIKRLDLWKVCRFSALIKELGPLFHHVRIQHEVCNQEEGPHLTTLTS